MAIQATNNGADRLNEQVCRTASMSNNEIIKRSYINGENVSQKKLSGRLLKALPAFAVGGIALTNGLITKGKLSNKTKSALYTIGTFAIVSAVYDGVHAAIRKIKEKDNNLKQADDKYPFAGFLTKVGASFGASILALKGIRGGVKKVANKFPNLAQQYKKMSENVSDIIDKSKLGSISDNVMKSLRNVADKHPKIASFAKRNSFLLIIAGYIGLSTLLSVKYEKDKQKAIYNKAEELSKQREKAQGIIKKAEAINTKSM